MKSMILLVALMLAGCMSIPADPTKMTSAQMAAWAKDKNANISCGAVSGPVTGSAVGTYVVLDKGVVVNGKVTVDSKCNITIENTK